MMLRVSICDHLLLFVFSDVVLRCGTGEHRNRLYMAPELQVWLYLLKGQTILLARKLWCSQEAEPEREMSLCQKLLQMEKPVCLGSPWLWEEPFGKVIGRSCLAAWVLETVLGWSESGMQQRWLVEQITIWWAGCCSSCCTDWEERVPVSEAKLLMTWSDRHNKMSPLPLSTP